MDAPLQLSSVIYKEPLCMIGLHGKSIFSFQQINLAHLVPPLVVFLAKNPVVSDYDISSLRRVLCGAAPLGQDVTEACLERHPGIESLNQGIYVFNFAHKNYKKILFYTASTFFFTCT